MAPEPATLLAAEPAAEVALPAAPVTDAMRPVEDELPELEEEPPVLEEEELPVLVPEELELPVLDALEPEEVEELPPVMLLRREPVRLSIRVYGACDIDGSLTWGIGSAREDGAFEDVSRWTMIDDCSGLLEAPLVAHLRW
jgi:hypothetical protein